jgi:hypothetical protein
VEARPERRAAGNAWNAKQESQRYADQAGNIRMAISGQPLPRVRGARGWHVVIAQ